MGYKDTRIQEYKDTRIQGYKDTRLQGYKDTRIQEYKDTKIQRYKFTLSDMMLIMFKRLNVNLTPSQLYLTSMF